MAINYTKIGWDNNTYVNPTHMNDMDNGIKAACDGVDAHDTAIAGCVKLSSTGSQRISAPNSVPLYISGNTYSGAVPILLRYEDESQNLLGGLGVTGDHKPTFFYNNTYKEIALKDSLPSAAAFAVSASGSAGTLSNYSYYYGKVAVIRINVSLPNVSSGQFTVAKLASASAMPAYGVILNGSTSEYLTDVAYTDGEYIKIGNQAGRTYNGLYAIMLTTILV